MDHFSTSGSTQRANKELVVVVLAHAKLQAGNSSRAVTNEIINATIATPPGRQSDTIRRTDLQHSAMIPLQGSHKQVFTGFKVPGCSRPSQPIW